jgi:hypothetical protein
MGTLSGGNGGGWPPDELPELPSEWGAIVIPDDASELAREATRVRRELRWQAFELRWRRRLHLPRANPGPGEEEDMPALGVPLLVILIATIATLTSLFVISWPTRPQQSDLQPTAVVTPSVGIPASGSGDPRAPSAGPDVPGPTAAVMPRALGTVTSRSLGPVHSVGPVHLVFVGPAGTTAQAPGTSI